MRALRPTLAFLAVLCACGRTSTQQQAIGACKSDKDCGAGQTCNTRGFCQATLGCKTNADCGANKLCDVPSGACLCANDQGCAAGQYCNANSRCQPVSACTDDADCPAGKICSSADRTCIPAGSCGGTLQCPLGQICDSTRSTCVPGCHDSGDCPQTAIDGGVTVFAPEACINGQCQGGGKCTSNSGCTFNQVCNGSQTCVSDCTSNTPYCASCNPTPPNEPCGSLGLPPCLSTCGAPNNFCLTDPRDNANCAGPGPGCQYFCGIDCSGGQACPSGYVCTEIVLTPTTGSCTCGQPNACPVGPCQCNEGATSGFCLCQSDADCGYNPFTENMITCSGGYCVLGSNCAPATGLYCDVPGPHC